MSLLKLKESSTGDVKSPSYKCQKMCHPMKRHETILEIRKKKNIAAHEQPDYYL